MSCFPQFDIKRKDELFDLAKTIKLLASLMSTFSPQDTIRALEIAMMLIVVELDICPTCVWNVLGRLFEHYEDDWNERHPELQKRNETIQ